MGVSDVQIYTVSRYRNPVSAASLRPPLRSLHLPLAGAVSTRAPVGERPRGTGCQWALAGGLPDRACSCRARVRPDIA